MADKKLLIKLAADVESLKKGLRQSSQQVDSFAASVRKMGLGMAASFSVKAIADFTLEIIKLSGEAQGVREAFERLPDSAKLMVDLKSATHGTVAELDLMKRAVMASNFDISLKALPQLLEFATIRAKQTGQSVDYLVDSIVTGIGRKSKLILDNLGISAVQLTEALGGASTAAASIADVADAVGKIAGENLKKMGTLSENSSTKLERLAATWKNLQVAMGDAANGTGLVGSVMDGLNERLEILASKNLPLYIKGLALMADQSTVAKVKTLDLARAAAELAKEQKVSESITRQAKQAIATFGTDLKAIEAAYKRNVNYQKIINEVTRINIEAEKKKAEAIHNEKNLTELLNSLREDAVLAIGKERAEINKQVQAIEKEITALQKLGIEKEKQKDFSGLRKKGADISGIKPKGFNETAQPLVEGIVKKRDTGTKALHEQSKLVKELVNDTRLLGIVTKQGMQQASDAYKKFLTDGNLEKYQEQMGRIIQKEQLIANGAVEIGEALGEGFGEAIAGVKTFAQAMGDAAKKIIKQLLMIAKMQLLANASKFGVAGLLAVGVGFGILEALVNNIGEGGGKSKSGSEGKSYSAGGGRSANIKVSGEFTTRGTDLVATIRNTNRYNSRGSTVNYTA